MFYPATEWDMESILQAFAGILFTLLVAAGSVYLCAPDFAQKFIDKWSGVSASTTTKTGGPTKTVVKNTTTATSGGGGGVDDWDDVILIGGQKQQKKSAKKK